MTSTSRSATTISASLVSTPGANETDRSFVRFCTATRATSIRTPERRVIRSALASSRRTSAVPTLPQPRMPTRTNPSSLLACLHPIHASSRTRSSEILSAHNDPGGAIAHEHHRRALDLVVIRRHRVRVRPGDRRRENVTHRDVGGQVRVAHEQVALLAVLAGDGRDLLARGSDAAREERLVARAVGDRAQVVAHAAVDGDVGAHAGNLLDRPHRVEGETRRRRDRPAGLDREPRLRPNAVRRDRLRERFLERGGVLRDRRTLVGRHVANAEPAAQTQLADGRARSPLRPRARAPPCDRRPPRTNPAGRPATRCDSAARRTATTHLARRARPRATRRRSASRIRTSSLRCRSR